MYRFKRISSVLLLGAGAAFLGAAVFRGGLDSRLNFEFEVGFLPDRLEFERCMHLLFGKDTSFPALSGYGLKISRDYRVFMV